MEMKLLKILKMPLLQCVVFLPALQEKGRDVLTRAKAAVSIDGSVDMSAASISGAASFHFVMASHRQPQTRSAMH